MCKCECVTSCVQLIDAEKGEPECRHVWSIDFVFLCDVHMSMVASFKFVIVSKFNNYWLTKFLY